MLTIYRLFSAVALPFVFVWLLLRSLRGKELIDRIGERLGGGKTTRPGGHIIWIHASSVGESISVLPLIKELLDHYPRMHALVTTGTVTSAKMMADKLPERAIHQFVPIDSLNAVKKFLRRWRPDLALFVESELWPNLICESRLYCPLILLNARMSDRSYRRWKQLPDMARTILSNISLVLAQGNGDAERFSDLGAPAVEYIGNLKYDSPPLPADVAALTATQSMIGRRPVWLAASTHNGEEAIIADAHHQLKKTIPSILTVLVPRHSNRGDAIAAMLTSQELTISRRSRGESVSEKTDIYLADTMGELGIFYRLCPVAFIGGSLVPHGGQNILEAARLNCAVLCGPYMDNFGDIIAEFAYNESYVRVEDANGLARAVATLFKNGAEREKLSESAYRLVISRQGVMGQLIEAINPYLRKLEQESA